MDCNFMGKNLEECLCEAERQLSIPRNELVYKIIKEEKSIFRKHCEIKVIEKSKNQDKNSNLIDIVDNKILIKDKQNKFNLDFEEDIELYVNNERAVSGVEVTFEDTITFKLEGVKAKREIKIDTSDKVQAKMFILYTPEYKPVLKYEKAVSRIKLKKEFEDGELPPKYSKEDILEVLSLKQIVYGIDESIITKVVEMNEVNGEVIAEGVNAEDDENDKIKTYFDSVKKNIDENSIENVDYKNMYSIGTVKSGDIIAELIVGEIGKDGIDVFGGAIKRKVKKQLKLKIGVGCKIQDNKVFAITEGRPSIKNGVFNVFKIFETSKDVDIKSGNIDFIGDIKINGNVKEGMKVTSGNSIEINGNIERGTIIAQGEVRVSGSVISSNITAGTKDLDRQLYIDNLRSLKKDLELLIASVKQIKESSVLGAEKEDGEIIKLLIETKFNSVIRVSILIMSISSSLGNSSQYIYDFIKEKLIGFGPLKIKFANELYDFIRLIEKEIEVNELETIIPVNIYVGYCQDGKIESSGKVIIKGKGMYTSEITAKDGIEVLSKGAVVRGGSLKANNYIKVSTVGSSAGVSTILHVSKNGKIEAEVAYQNTVFCFEERQYILEAHSKNIKAYLDKDGEIVVEKFVF